MAKNIKLVKSLIGRKKDQIATANSLGLKKVGDVSVQPENEATLGKIQNTFRISVDNMIYFQAFIVLLILNQFL